MGIGVESDSTFAGHIHHSTDSISVLNPSLIGYSNADYLNISRNVIQSDSLSNQINSTYLFWCLNDIYANEFSTIGFTSDSILDRLVALFRNHSKLFHFLKATLTDRPKQYFAHDVKFYSESDPNFKQAIRNLASIDSIAIENNIPFTIVLLPYEYQLRDDARITSSPYNVFEKHLSSEGIKYLNLTDQLSAYKTPSQELYLYGDGIHFSTLGHKLIAEELLKSLN